MILIICIDEEYICNLNKDFYSNLFIFQSLVCQFSN